MWEDDVWPLLPTDKSLISWLLLFGHATQKYYKAPFEKGNFKIYPPT